MSDAALALYAWTRGETVRQARPFFEQMSAASRRHFELGAGIILANALVVPLVRMIDRTGRPWHELPQCSAIISDATLWLRRHPQDPRCGNRAQYLFDGRPLCHRHASIASLDILSRGNPPVPVPADKPALTEA